MDNNITNSTKVNTCLLHVANTILCNFSMTSTPDLINGRMGVCLFLYEYARLTGIKEYEDIADDMIDLILKILHKGQNEENIGSLSGIGIGVIYLITHNFLEDTDEQDSLEEIDNYLLKEIEKASAPTEMLIPPILYFIYRFLYYRGGINRKCYHILAQQILILFQDYECKGEEDCIILNFILQNVTLIYKQSQIEKKNLDKIISPFGMAFDYNLEPMTPEKMWYGFLFDKTSHKRVINEDTLLSLCQNCFYDADRIVGILCSYGLMLMNLNNLKS